MNVSKICKICHQDCSSEERFQDSQGQYFHAACHRKEQGEQSVSPPDPPPPPPPLASTVFGASRSEGKSGSGPTHRGVRQGLVGSNRTGWVLAGGAAGVLTLGLFFLWLFQQVSEEGDLAESDASIQEIAVQEKSEPDSFERGERFERGDVTVRLLNAGKDPKRLLEYRIKEETIQNLTLSQTWSFVLVSGNFAMPEIHFPEQQMTFEIASKGIPDAPPFRYDLLVTDSRIAANRQAAPDFIVEMIRQNERMVGVSGEGRLDPRGLHDSLNLKVPPSGRDTNAVASLREEQFSNDFWRMVQSMGVILPVEEVGEGAVWMVRWKDKSNDIAFVLTATCFLTRLDGNQMSLDLQHKLETSTNPYGISAETLIGKNATLESLEMKGTERVEIDLSRMVPLASHRQDEMTVLASQDGQRIRFKLSWNWEMKSD
ncbi:MAG: hypothetical protein P8L18_12205 [Verrucomicrobiota bacterium]|nr:hypothetical protein [Verrucomicrobiota bacterium]